MYAFFTCNRENYQTLGEGQRCQSVKHRSESTLQPSIFQHFLPNKISWGTQTTAKSLATFTATGYNPYIGGLKPLFFMVLGSKGMVYLI